MIMDGPGRGVRVTVRVTDDHHPSRPRRPGRPRGRRRCLAQQPATGLGDLGRGAGRGGVAEPRTRTELELTAGQARLRLRHWPGT
jgi:hypothetical protein